MIDVAMLPGNKFNCLTKNGIHASLPPLVSGRISRGRCQAAHIVPKTMLAMTGEKRRSSIGSAKPRQPISSRIGPGLKKGATANPKIARDAVGPKRDTVCVANSGSPLNKDWMREKATKAKNTARNSSQTDNASTVETPSRQGNALENHSFSPFQPNAVEMMTNAARVGANGNKSACHSDGCSIEYETAEKMSALRFFANMSFSAAGSAVGSAMRIVIAASAIRTASTK